MDKEIIGIGLIALAIAIGLFGISSCTARESEARYAHTESDYQTCIDRCPTGYIGNDFNGLECPKMCFDLVNKTPIK